jgi:hypothetical protein
MHKLSSCAITKLLALCVVLSASSHRVGAVELAYKKIMLSGDVAPGTDGAAFSAHVPGVGFSSMNGRGDVVFEGAYDGEAGSPAFGIWKSDSDGALSLVARRGTIAPETAGATYEYLHAPLINDQGEVLFGGSLFQVGFDGASAEGLWRQATDGSTKLVARQGSAAPGGNGEEFSGFFNCCYFTQAFSSAGASFEGYLQDVHRNEDGTLVFIDSKGGAIWGPGPGGSLQLLALQGAPAPGIPGALFSTFDTGLIRGVNELGQVAFSAKLREGFGGVNNTNDSGLWMTDSTGQLVLVAREGGLTPDGGTFKNAIGDAGINAAGELIFHATVVHGGNETSGYWRRDAVGNLTPLVTRQADAPGTGGATFQGLSSVPVMNANGDAAFWATIRDTTSSPSQWSLWGPGEGGLLQLLARENSVAPGTEGGVFVPRYERLDLNARGDVLFNGYLKVGTGDVTQENNEGVWFYSSALQQVLLIARSGQLFDVDDDPAVANLKTIGNVVAGTGSGGQDGKRSSLSEDGKLLLNILFTDGTAGLFVVAVVPEPTSFVLAGGVAVAFLSGMRVRRTCK